ncbi:MAG: hypothetical protein WD184_05330 [Acidimicrobiia bacterium]
MAKNESWSDTEIRASLECYTAMVLLEHAGIGFSKADFRRLVEGMLAGRSEKAIDFKWCNVSAILEESGFSYLSAYKPMEHYQERLRELTGVWMLEHPLLRKLLSG